MLSYIDTLPNGDPIVVIRHDELSFENISTEFDTYITGCDISDFTFTFSTVIGLDKRKHYLITTHDYNDRYIAIEIPKDPFKRLVAIRRSGELDELGDILIRLFRL